MMGEELLFWNNMKTTLLGIYARIKRKEMLQKQVLQHLLVARKRLNKRRKI